MHNIVGQSVFEGQVLLNPFHNNTRTMNVKLEQKILIIQNGLIVFKNGMFPFYVAFICFQRENNFVQ